MKISTEGKIFIGTIIIGVIGCCIITNFPKKQNWDKYNNQKVVITDKFEEDCPDSYEYVPCWYVEVNHGLKLPVSIGKFEYLKLFDTVEYNFLTH